MNKPKTAAGIRERPRMWELRQETGRPDTLQLYIYGYVEGDSYNFWTDEVVRSETSAEFFREELEKYPNTRTIEIFINSMGGSVLEGTAIYNQLMRHPAHKTVYIDGFAASIASVIAMAGDEIIMPANTLMMIHNMSWGIYGTPAELRKSADDLAVINETGREAYLQKAGDKLSRERLTEMMDAETWLPARECVELGLADRIAGEARTEGSEGAPAQRGRAVTLAARAMGFDKLAARLEEAEKRAEEAEQRAAEAEKQAQARAEPPTPSDPPEAANAAQKAAEAAEDGKDAEDVKTPFNLMAALCGLN